jgi:broad specificity phosphatase PhoE
MMPSQSFVMRLCDMLRYGTHEEHTRSSALENTDRDSSKQESMSFYVMRHFQRGESPEFSTNLTEEGHRRARALFIPRVVRVVTSPFKRCVQSAQHMEDLEVPMRISCALGEFIDHADHGVACETYEQMVARVSAFIRDDAQQRAAVAGATLYVTHKSCAEVIAPLHTFHEGTIIEVIAEAPGDAE